LGIFGDPSSITILQKIIQDDPQYSVRSAAIKALAKLQGATVDVKKLEDASLTKEYNDMLKRLEPANERLKGVTSKLPPVTAVEVYRLAAYLPDANPAHQIPKDAELFPMNPDGYSLVVTGKVVLKGKDAEQLAHEWRNLTFGVQYQALCHSPIYGIKFMSNSRLLFETTICWHCSDFSLADGGYGGFDSSKESSNILKSHLEALLPPLK